MLASQLGAMRSQGAAWPGLLAGAGGALAGVGADAVEPAGSGGGAPGSFAAGRAGREAPLPFPDPGTAGRAAGTVEIGAFSAGRLDGVVAIDK